MGTSPAQNIAAIAAELPKVLLDLRFRLGEMVLTHALGERVGDLSKIADMVDLLDQSVSCITRLKELLGISDATCDAECILLEQVAKQTHRLVHSLRGSMEHLGEVQVGRIRRLLRTGWKVATRTLRYIFRFVGEHKWLTILLLAFVTAVVRSPPDIRIDAKMGPIHALATLFVHGLYVPACHLMQTRPARLGLFCYFVVAHLSNAVDVGLYEKMTGLKAPALERLSTTTVTAPQSSAWRYLWAVLYVIFQTVDCVDTSNLISGFSRLGTGILSGIYGIVSDGPGKFMQQVGAAWWSGAAAGDSKATREIQRVAELVNTAFRSPGSTLVVASVAALSIGMAAAAMGKYDVDAEDGDAVAAFRERMVRKDSLDKLFSCDVDARNALNTVDGLLSKQVDLMRQLGLPADLAGIPPPSRSVPIAVIHPSRAQPGELGVVDGTPGAKPGAEVLARRAERSDRAQGDPCELFRRVFEAIDDGVYRENPFSGRPIKKGGPTYAKLVQTCHS